MQCRVAILLLLVAEAPAAFEADDNSIRAQSIAAKMYCNCSCGEMLSECAHLQCTRKDALKKEIADAILKADTDVAILEQMRAKYGETILAAPKLRGFSIVLWAVPVAIPVIVLAIMLVRWRKFRTLQGQGG